MIMVSNSRALENLHIILVVTSFVTQMVPWNGARGANSYVKKMMINYETMFGDKPHEYNTPMAEKGYPEIDNPELLDATCINNFSLQLVHFSG
jgi:hypothetical protein